MKRRITVEQLQELTEEQQQRLREWWKPQYQDVYAEYDGCLDCYEEMTATYPKQPDQNDLPLLDIGQMIELLDNNSISEKEFAISHVKHGAEYYYEVLAIDKNERYETFESAEELVDALWQAVKQIL